ncbi:nucleoside/nucleotide kinase family protein [Dryocola clanedunensis]|uniref:thymidylate kinase n=1 Tax=Cedecea sulfonylureivorans TaxID=3051154 RepID=UPI001927C8EA|nr:thymidylate kinase [Cedecea sulfonylureivorans]
MSTTLPPLIAIIGSDGSGKSTVCEHLIEYVKKYGPASMVHLGKQAGNVGRAVSQLPLVGRPIGKAIEHKAKKINADKTHYDLLSALVVSAFVVRRRRRFRCMLALREKGFIVLADRFPQLQFPGAYDGPTFPADVEGSFFVKWLAAYELATFQWMTEHKPDLVIKLNVDLEVACARKPDHLRASLERKIAVTPLLTFNGADIVNIDTNLPLDKVLCEAEKAVAKFMAAKKYRYLGDRSSGDIITG